MEEGNIRNSEDISREIERTAPQPEQVVTKNVAEKEERIAEGVAEIPPTTETSMDLEERKEKVINFLKQKKQLIYYLVLAIITYVGVFIRTRNIPRLKDITTGTWTLGPDLDPFLFLRWAKYIVEHGKIFALDVMRSVPLAEFCSGALCSPINTAREMKLLPYLIAWFYHFLSFFSKEVTVTYAAIIFPVMMFGLTTIAFFLFARKIFYKEKQKIRNIIALVATSLFVLIPSLLPRTIAGIPEKESAAFFFMFIGFYFFLEAFTSEKLKKGIIFGVLAGLATASMAMIWGGVLFIFFTIPTAVFLAFLFGKVRKKEVLIYFIWIVTSFTTELLFSARHSLKNLITSTSTGWAVGVFIIIAMNLFIIKNDKLTRIRRKTKIPKEVFSVIISVIVLFLLISFTFGPSLISKQIFNVKSSLITPISDRFGLTVAENKQPYFLSDWKNSFGPVYFNIPLFFWLFFVGSIALFNNLITRLGKKERRILTFSYFVFLICLIFSRYSPGSTLDGVSGLSLTVYFGGWLFFLGSFGYFYYKIYHEREFNLFREFNFAYLLYFIILTLGIIGARGGIRLIMVLGAISPVAIAFLVVKTSQKYLMEKDDAMKLFIGIVALIIIIATIFTLWTYYQSDKATATNFAPGAYQWQWQKAMSWVRENTQENAVFAHWWDYGYWVQSIGERATILDGGNAIVYWNHLLGRHVLTGPDERKAAEFLYTHNGTHLLIDSTEIGKYTAYASIGSDENYDRFSWIATFLMDDKQTQETNNETLYIYPGGTAVDEDIIWEENGQKVFFPKKVAAVGAILVRKSGDEILQPESIFVYNGKQYNIPLRFAYFNNELHDYKSGLEAGVFFFPKLDTLSDGRSSINPIGAAMYLSRRTVHSQLAQLYLFDQESDYFKLVHVEDNLMIENMKQQSVEIGNFVYYRGFQGPIKIWEVEYPSDMKVNPDYLEIEFPDKKLYEVKPGEY